MRRGAVVRLIVIGVLVGAVATAIAILVPWLPDRASDQGAEIDFVFWFVTAICIMIFSLVAAVSIYSYLRFRAPPDDDSDGPPIHGHTGLEIAWTAVPAILVTVMGILSAVALARNDRLPEDHITVEVSGRQFAWSFFYPARTPGTEGEERNLLQCARKQGGAGCVASANLRLPLGVAAELRMIAQDVIHSFWVPEFRQKQDLLPGEVTRIIVTPTKKGTYTVVCTELCGLGHAAMRTKAIVMERAAFEDWLEEQRRAGAGGPGEAGRAAFTANGCAGCHTFGPAGSEATTGPNLDELGQQARRAGKPLEEFVRESIVEPDAYVERGYSKDVMPETFDQLPPEQLDALVQYLARGSQGER